MLLDARLAATLYAFLFCRIFGLQASASLVAAAAAASAVVLP
jgi:hypothetical protein